MEGSVSTDTLVCVCDIVTVRFHPVVKVLLTQCGDCQWKVVCLQIHLCVILLLFAFNQLLLYYLHSVETVSGR